MWCRTTRQPAESWMILTRAERKAMADLATEIAEQEQAEIKKARANAARARSGRGVRRAR